MNEFTFHTLENSTGKAKEVLTNVKAKYGFVPNLFGYMAEAPYIIEAYAMLNNLLSKTDLTAAQQQIALLAVSHYNNCEFCRVAHRAFGKINQSNAQTLDAIVNDKPIEDANDNALVKMVVAIVDGRGWVNDEQLDSFFNAGFSKKNVYDLIFIVTVKTLSNYANHLTKPKANEQLIAML